LQRPLNLARYLICPGRRLIGALIKISTSSKAICSIFARAAQNNVAVLHLSMTPLERTEEATALVFFDMTEAKIAPEEFLEELKVEVEVLEVIGSPVEGFIADTATHPLVAGPTRAIIMREAGYRELLLSIREFFGKGAEAFLYHVGFRFGLGLGKLHRDAAEKIGLRDPVKIYRHISTAMFQWAGFGRIEVKELDEDGGEIIVHDSFECELVKGIGVIPYSQFVRGSIAGTLSELFNRGFHVLEKECIAKGDRFCRYVIRALPQR